MSNHYIVTVPNSFTHEGQEKTRFTRVGVAFAQDPEKKSHMKIKLDFPVGATEFVLFEPKTPEDDDNESLVEE